MLSWGNSILISCSTTLNSGNNHSSDERKKLYHISAMLLMKGFVLDGEENLSNF